MADMFEELQKRLEQFVEQRDDLMLVLGCQPAETMYVLKTLSTIEEADSPDLFLVFADDFIQLAPYVSVVIERLKIQHQECCKALEEEGREPWQPLPERVLDETRSPAERLKAAMLYVRSELIPPEGGHRLVWGLFPMNIEGRDEYSDMVEQLVPRNGIEPWMRGLRLIVRDDTDSPMFSPNLENAQRVQFHNPDLSPGSMVEAMEEEVADPETSDEDWAQSLLMLACMDYAHQKYEDALHGYRQLLGYYQSTEDSTMQAFVMNGLGDVYHRQDDLEQAQEWYECAIIPATDAKAVTIMLAVARNLGHVSYKLKEYAPAEEYFDGADKLATELRDAEAKAEALEWRGLSQEEQKVYDKSIESWEAAVQLGRSLEMDEYIERNLEHLKRVFRKTRMRDRRREVDAELKEMKKKEKGNGK